MPDRTHNYDGVFDWIVAYKRAHDGNSPTVREIAQALGISSTSNVDHILARLERDGKITRSRVGHSRSICVVGARWGGPSTIRFEQLIPEERWDSKTF